MPIAHEHYRGKAPFLDRELSAQGIKTIFHFALLINLLLLKEWSSWTSILEGKVRGRELRGQVSLDHVIHDMNLHLFPVACYGVAEQREEFEKPRFLKQRNSSTEYPVRLRRGFFIAAASMAASIRKVGTIGCWGDSLAWLAATRLALPSVRCNIIDFIVEKPRAPVLLYFGRTGASIPRRTPTYRLLRYVRYVFD